MNERAISVVICTYNGRSRLEPTLQHLIKAANRPAIVAELVVLDNNSSDDTAGFCTTYLMANSGRLSWKVVKEPVPGLSYARKSGFVNSIHPFLIFVDDDNWLQESYLEVVTEVMLQDPKIGILGGIGFPVFEAGKPDWFEAHSRSYAVGPQHQNSGNIQEGGIIYGAGMVVRRSFLGQLYDAGFESQLTDRRGQELSSGGDNEWSLWCRRLGYTMYYDSRLQFKHFIPDSRLDQDYLIRRAAAKGQVEAVFRIYDSVLNGKGAPLFMRSTLAWYWDLFKRCSWWLVYRLSPFTLERRMAVALLAASIRFRFYNRKRLLSVFEYIHDLNKKFT